MQLLHFEQASFSLLEISNANLMRPMISAKERGLTFPRQRLESSLRNLKNVYSRLSVLFRWLLSETLNDL